MNLTRSQTRQPIDSDIAAAVATLRRRYGTHAIVLELERQEREAALACTAHLELAGAHDYTTRAAALRCASDIMIGARRL